MCNCKDYSCVITIMISILLGVLGGIVASLDIITDVNVLFVLFIVIAFIVDGFIYGVTVMPEYVSCIRKNSICLLVGIFGSTSIPGFALSIGSFSNIASSIVIGICVFFLSILIIEFVRLMIGVVQINSNNQGLHRNNFNSDSSGILNSNIGNSLAVGNEENNKLNYCWYNECGN